ncbi:MAG: NUDIX domain-containing protein [Candidatus Zambryskibacteria bacterium]|nr:NUDIX domain-containing protein [Candidatus Zambryskibacteria bacterium]
MTVKQGGYFAAVCITRLTKKGPQYLVQWSQDLTGPNTGRKLLKFPGGMEELEDNGNPEKTMRSEVEEETGFRINDDAEVTLLAKIVRVIHVQYFYLAWKRDCSGQKRAKVIKDGNSIHYPPFWASMDYLREHLHRTHRPVLEHLPT